MKLTNKICLLAICSTFSLLAHNFSYAVTSVNLAQDMAGNKSSMIDRQKNMQYSRCSGYVKHGVRIVEVQAFKYGYNPDPIVVKAGEKVRLLLTSKDVTHGFGVADLGINIKIPAGKTTVFEFTPKDVGTHTIRCTVYCGLGHGDMHGTLAIIK